MYIQDQISIGELDDEHLSFFRAIGVDSIHLELRGGAPARWASGRYRLGKYVAGAGFKSRQELH